MDSNSARNRGGNREGNLDRNGLSNVDGNAESYGQSNAEGNWDCCGGNGGGEFHRGQIRYRKGCS